MLIAAATILAGFIILIWSADQLVDGAASKAENMAMSPIIIDFTNESLGTTLLIAPLMVHQSCMKKELPLLLLATAGGALLILDGELTALDGGLMLGGLTILLWRMISTQIADPELSEEAEGEALPHLKPLRAWLSFILGLALLIGSSRMLVYGAVIAAKELGVSELVIGLTIVAVSDTHLRAHET